MALTNQSFNLAAQEQAKLLEVELWDKQQLLECMTQYPVQYREWVAALA
jgi:HJR/Mrr/RecB family endonuclease